MNFPRFTDKYEFGEKIGEGVTSVVKVCFKKGSDSPLIVKVMKFKDTEEVLTEVNEHIIHQKTSHENIVKCFDFIAEKETHITYLV